MKNITLIGAGIMSATLGTILKQLNPDLTIQIFERLDSAAAESSDAWNNAGTGHSAFCELNYTPQKPDGSINPYKAIQIAEQFEQSKQFWSWSGLTQKERIELEKSIYIKIIFKPYIWNIFKYRRNYL